MLSRLPAVGKNLLNRLKCFSLGQDNSQSSLSYQISSPINKYKRLLMAPFCTSVKEKSGLMEFFDDENNWELNEVRVGRSWRKEELRIKSNEDLHKLWFVLLKERNMLLTMQHEYNRLYEFFPSPERLDKVKESMVNLEDVVRERNRAYYLLETGETGERPGYLAKNALGMDYFYKASEHILPKRFNNSWFKKRQLWYNKRECEKFLLLYKEKKFLEKRKARNRDRNHVLGLLKRFPDIDMEVLQEQYPDLDVKRLKNSRKAQGHFVSE